MKDITDEVVIDEKQYFVRFRGFHMDMEVCKSNGKTVKFSPLNHHDKMMTIRENLITTKDGLMLSYQSFSIKILNICCPELIPAEYEDFFELALWWANGSYCRKEDSPKDAKIHSQNHSIELKPWKNSERILALSNNITDDESFESFDIVNYLDEMVRMSVDKITPEIDIDEIDSGISSELVDNVLNINIPEEHFHKTIQNNDAAKIYAEETLKLCSFLGWTPSRIYEIPAVEADSLLSLINFVKPAIEETSKKPSGLACYPDAVVFKFEDE